MQTTRAHYGVTNLAALLLLLGSTSVRQATAQARPQTESAQQAAAPSAQDRHKAMQADVQRLLEMARHLKQDVDSSRKDELSVKVIRDADEIDKLARSARGRIR